MPTEIEARAAQVVKDMKERISALQNAKPLFRMVPFDAAIHFDKNDDTIKCAGNQHTCQPQFFVPVLNKRFSLILKGTGDSDIVGSSSGPRALVWKNTRLEGDHPELGHVTLQLEPEKAHAGTLVPVLAEADFPALNRNNYHFVFDLPGIGEITSDRPAIVEALIDSVPPKGVYVFQNGPVNFHKKGDPEKKTIAILEAAVTDVEPA